MDRFDIPETVKAIINKAVEINLIDSIQVYVLADTFGSNYTALVDQIVNYAYNNRHVNSDHKVICPLHDEFHKMLNYGDGSPDVTEFFEDEVEEVDFDTAFQIFYNGCIRINHNHSVENYPNIAVDKFSVNKGRRYMKVVRRGSVHCFVDRTNGDVLKAASWNAPAKHARGNIFDEDNGLGSMGEFGPAYLR